jgi:hypothetical protein
MAALLSNHLLVFPFFVVEIRRLELGQQQERAAFRFETRLDTPILLPIEFRPLTPRGAISLREI